MNNFVQEDYNMAELAWVQGREVMSLEDYLNFYRIPSSFLIDEFKNQAQSGRLKNMSVIVREQSAKDRQKGVYNSSARSNYNSKANTCEITIEPEYIIGTNPFFRSQKEKLAYAIGHERGHCILEATGQMTGAGMEPLSEPMAEALAAKFMEAVTGDKDWATFFMAMNAYKFWDSQDYHYLIPAGMVLIESGTEKPDLQKAKDMMLDAALLLRIVNPELRHTGDKWLFSDTAATLLENRNRLNTLATQYQITIDEPMIRLLTLYANAYEITAKHGADFPLRPSRQAALALD